MDISRDDVLAVKRAALMVLMDKDEKKFSEVQVIAATKYITAVYEKEQPTKASDNVCVSISHNTNIQVRAKTSYTVQCVANIKKSSSIFYVFAHQDLPKQLFMETSVVAPKEDVSIQISIYNSSDVDIIIPSGDSICNIVEIFSK